MDKDLNKSKQYSEMTIEELNNIVDNDIHLQGGETYFAKKELKIREAISNLENTKSTSIKRLRTKVTWQYFIDYKAIFSIAFIMIFTLIMVISSNYKKSSPPKNYAEYNLSTMGNVYDIKAKRILRQDLDGSHWVVSMYIVSYNYEAGRIKYSNKMTIPAIPGNNKYISYIERNLNKKVFPVKYMSRNHQKSIVDLTMIDE